MDVLLHLGLSNCNMFLCTDDAKLCRHITSQEDNISLQRAIDRFKNWSDTWLLELNVSKCKVVSYSMKDRTDTLYSISDNGETYAMDKKDKIKDLGVTFDYRLTFHDHIQEKVNRAYSMLGLIKRNFIYMDSNTFILLYTSLVRPHLEYENAVWCPYKIGYIEVIEKVQKGLLSLLYN